MEHQIFESAGFIAIGAILGGLLSGAVGLLVYKAVGGMSFSSQRRRNEARECFEEFAEKIRILEQKQEILGQYSSEYFNTLKEAGWEDLVFMTESLRSISNELHIMLDQKRFKEVKAVSDYLLGRLEAKEAREVVAAYDGLSELRNWRQSSTEILLRVIQATTNSAHETKELGISRNKRDRKPTLMTLSDLRGTLGDL